MKICVRVPATSANIGPGFDSLGLALALYCNVEFCESSGGISISGCDKKYATADNLALIAYKYTFERLGRQFDGVSVKIKSDIPVARGLGSSAALTVAGVVAANEMCGGTLTKQEILKICTELEGHPDNAAPAIYGELTASMMQDNIPYCVSYPVNENVSFIALVPPFETSTKAARALLPKKIAYCDAIHNISHTALLLKALEFGDAKLIAASLRDALHEPYRKALIPDFDRVKALALANGAAAFYISGSGSTCMGVFFEDNFHTKIELALSAQGIAWELVPLMVDYRGAKIMRREA